MYGRWKGYPAGLGVILVLALALRATGLTWGLRDSLNVDERFVIGLARGLLERLSTGGSLDPGASAYGALPLYLLATGTAIANEIVSWLNTFLPLPFQSAPILYVGRLISVLAAVAAVGMTAELARRLYGKATGLLGALFLAICLLPVREAHFATVDSLLAGLIMLTLLAGERIATQGTWRNYLLAAGAAALAASTKLTALVVLLPVLVAHVYRRWQIAQPLSGRPEVRNNPAIREIFGFPSLVRFATTVLSTLALWLAINPFILLNPQTYFDPENNASALTQWKVVHGDFPVLYTLQFENTLPWVYLLTNSLFWAMGPALEIAALAGIAWIGWQLLRSILGLANPDPALRKTGFADAYLLTWFLVYFLVVGGWHAKFIRYALPLIPVMCIFASRWLVELWRRDRPAARGLSALLTISILGATLLYTLGFLKIYREPDIRLTAAAWVDRQIPEGASIFVENDKGLYFHDAEKRFGLTGYTWKIWNPYEIDGIRGERPFQAPPVSDGQTRAYLESLLTTDYVIISTFWHERFKAAGEHYPVQVDFYRRLFDGSAGYRLIRKFQTYPQFGPFTWRDDRSEITFRLFDHPAVYVFEKTGNAPPGSIE